MNPAELILPPRGGRSGADPVLWCQTRASAPAHLSRDLLTSDEWERCAELRRPADRAARAVGRALLRLLAARVLGTEPWAITFELRCGHCGGPHGKPRARLRGRPVPGFDCNTAHSGDLVAVAAGMARNLGVDVELRSRPGLPALALRSLSPRELDHLPAGGAAAAVLWSWVTKEAILKATGHGLTIGPRSVEVEIPAGGGPRLIALPPSLGLAREWELMSKLDGDGVLVLASRREFAATPLEVKFETGRW